MKRLRRSKKKTTYYLEPLDPEANAHIFAALARLCRASEDNVFDGKLDIEGEGHDVIEVEEHAIRRVQYTVRNFHQRFAVYSQKEGRERMERLRPAGNSIKPVTTAVRSLFRA